MGDEQHGGTGVVVEQSAIQFLLCWFVERAAYLVEQHYVATTQQSAGYGYALCLTFAQSAAALAQFGVQSVGQIGHKVGTCRVQRLAQFVVGGGGLG